MSAALPEPLPPGERLLWQGAPSWRVLAISALHVRKVVIYFALLLLWEVGVALNDGGGAKSAVASGALLTILCLLAVGVLSLLAWLMQRSTWYGITDRRVIIRFGVALPVTLNLPFQGIAGAALRPAGGRHGDIALQLSGGERLGYAILWPHARPWRLRRPEPMLRAIPDAAEAARILGSALAGVPRPAPSMGPATEAARPVAGNPALA